MKLTEDPISRFLTLVEASMGCLMTVFPVDLKNQIVNWTLENIPADQLAPDGIDYESHVTVLYGFPPEVSLEHIGEFFGPENLGKIPVRLGKISRFENQEHDVLKVEVHSPRLTELNDKLAKTFNIVSDYASYVPHCTLAYLRRGACKELDGHGKFDGWVVPVTHLVYSTGSSTQKTEFPVI